MILDSQIKESKKKIIQRDQGNILILYEEAEFPVLLKAGHGHFPNKAMSRRNREVSLKYKFNWEGKKDIIKNNMSKEEISKLMPRISCYVYQQVGQGGILGT